MNADCQPQRPGKHVGPAQQNARFHGNGQRGEQRGVLVAHVQQAEHQRTDRQCGPASGEFFHPAKNYAAHQQFFHEACHQPCAHHDFDKIGPVAPSGDAIDPRQRSGADHCGENCKTCTKPKRSIPQCALPWQIVMPAFAQPPDDQLVSGKGHNHACQPAHDKVEIVIVEHWQHVEQGAQPCNAGCHHRYGNHHRDQRKFPNFAPQRARRISQRNRFFGHAFAPFMQAAGRSAATASI